MRAVPALPRWLAPLALAALVLGPQPGRATDDVRRATMIHGAVERSYRVLAPDVPAPAPLLLLLHGSQQRGRDVIAPWSALARREGLLLVAPDSMDGAAWKLPTDGPAFLRALITEVSRGHAVDCTRIYLFGYSGGAVFALTLAVLDAEQFAATAVFAGAWREPVFFQLLPHATRRMPVAIFAGTRDRFFPTSSVEATAGAFAAAGHTVQVRLLEGRGHAYAPVADRVNTEAWAFMRSVRLERAAPGCTESAQLRGAARHPAGERGLAAVTAVR